jgi:putative copper resistance protein D
VWDAWVVLAKAVTYGGALAAAGGVGFVAYSQELLQAPVLRRIRRLIGSLLVAAAVGTAAKICAVADSMSGDSRGMFDADLLSLSVSSGEGVASAVRLAGVLVMSASLFERRRRPRPLLSCLGGVAAATSFAWVGHVHALETEWLPLVLIGVHLLGVAFWIGALAPLYIVAGGGDLPAIARTLMRFGTAALGVVAAMLLAGAILLALLLSSLGELWSEVYGRLFLGKIALVGILLGFAAFNHWRLTPRLLAHDATAARAMRQSIGCEIVLAALVLLVTATLTTVAGP